MAIGERIEGAGAVLWQVIDDGDVRIAIIHRPRYDDWSLPKGGVDAGESHIQAAFREVLEETGVKAIFGPEIGTVDYEVNGVTKEVRYWLAEADQINAATPNPEEVDAIEWLSISDAINKLSNSDDREIVRMAEEFGFGSTPLVLLRHAKALKRDLWDGDDGDRPLEHVGQIQAAKIPGIYAPYAIEKIYSSDAIRCVQTIEAMAAEYGITPIYSSEISEFGFEKDSERALDYALSVMLSDKPSVMCSHNPVLPKLVKKLIGKKNFKRLSAELKPGDSFVLHHRSGDVIAVDWTPAPKVEKSK
ncbi:MAG: NUDIX hydrolase [Actinomycetota bacterium]|nr:NUDIX hydrolase [Actinomycetota bacterium]